jgi:adenine-specific DNA-methyltransferase
MQTEHQSDPTLFQFDAPRPIKGFPTLHWQGKRPFTSTQYYPAQLKETYGRPVDGWLNEIYWGDNLQVMSHLLKKYRGQVKLVYIDPPFDSKADYKKKIQLRGKQLTNDGSAFEDKQYTDIWTNDEYLQFFFERLILVKELLDEFGSIYVHCDWHKSHFIRCMLDEIFGINNFRNEIIWKRSDAHGNIGQGTKHFGPVHDTIFFYSKTEQITWNQQYTPLSQDYMEKFYRYKEKDGRVYKLDNLLGPGGASKGNPVYEFLGVTRAWRFSKIKMEQLYDNGRIVQTNPGTVPMYKRYLDESKGIPLQTIWSDISMIRGWSGEKLDYPTQKPEELIERIISASSNPGDLVFDCFMGSGTTQAVAMKLGRRFIGADINLGAVQTTTKRLLGVAAELQEKQTKQAKKIQMPQQMELSIAAEPDMEYQTKAKKEEDTSMYYTGFSVYNVNHYDVFRNPLEARDLLLQALEVQPYPSGSLYDGEKDGRQVKIMPVNRIATRVDLNGLITGFNLREFEERSTKHPGRPVESITLVCMGHEPDLAAALKEQVPYKLDVEVVDILRDKANLEFKRDAEAEVVLEDGHVVIRQFFPMNLLQKLSLMKENVDDWRELVESIMIDFSYDGAVLEPSVVDIPDGKDLVSGKYPVPKDAGTIHIKITDLLSEPKEITLKY